LVENTRSTTQQKFTERNTTGGGVTRTSVFDSGMKTAVLTVTLPNTDIHSTNYFLLKRKRTRRRRES